MPGVQGGVERHCEHLYPLMARQGELRVRVYRRRPYLSDEARHATIHGIEWVDLPSTRVKGFEALFHTFLAVCHIAFHRPQAVHVHNMGPGLFIPLLRLLRLPVVMTYHSVNYEHKKWGPVSRVLLRLSEWLSLRWATKIIFVNRFRMEAMSERVRRKAVFIPNGVKEANLVDGDEYLRSLGLERGDYLLAVGRLTEEKGFDTLIKALDSINGIETLVIAGASDHGSNYADALRRLTADSGKRVVFTGFVTGDDLAALYTNARLFVLPSRSEGFPLVLLEAMSYRLPVAVSDIEACRMVDLPDDCYFTPGDSKALATVVNNCLAASPRRIAYNLTPYAWPAIADRTLAQFPH